MPGGASSLRTAAGLTKRLLASIDLVKVQGIGAPDAEWMRNSGFRGDAYRNWGPRCSAVTHVAAHRRWLTVAETSVGALTRVVHGRRARAAVSRPMPYASSAGPRCLPAILTGGHHKRPRGGLGSALAVQLSTDVERLVSRENGRAGKRPDRPRRQRRVDQCRDRRRGGLSLLRGDAAVANMLRGRLADDVK